MLLGNYAAAWLGALFLHAVWTPYSTASAQTPLYDAWRLIVGGWAALFVLTILVELFFVGWTLQLASGRRWGFGTILRATLIVNVVSYAGLVALYWQVCPVSLVTQTRLDPSLSFVRVFPATVYYLDAPGGDVWQVRLDGTGRRQVADAGARAPVGANREVPRLGTGQPWPELGLRPNRSTGKADLICRAGTGEWEQAPVVAAGVGPVLLFADPETRDSSGPLKRPEYEARWTMGSHDYATDLRPVGETEGKAWLGTWAAEGVGLTRRLPGGQTDRVQLALETPFLALVPSHGTLLQGDVLVCQYSDYSGHADEIAVINLRTREVGVLARGTSPVVVLDQPPPGARAWDPKRDLLPGEAERKAREKQNGKL